MLLLGDRNGCKLLDLIPKMQKSNSIQVLVGPEGGFTEEEMQLVQSKTDSNFVSLSANRLRVETAALCFVSNVVGALHSDSLK